VLNRLEYVRTELALLVEDGRYSGNERVTARKNGNANQPKRIAQPKVFGSASVCRREGAARDMTSLQGARL